MGKSKVINSGHVLSVGGLVLSGGGFYSISQVSAVFACAVTGHMLDKMLPLGGLGC